MSEDMDSTVVLLDMDSTRALIAKDLDSTEVLLDSTQALLAEDLDSTDVLLASPSPHSYYQDSEEDEIFFGPVSSSVKAKRSLVCTRRQTMAEDEFNKFCKSRTTLSMPLSEKSEDFEALQEAEAEPVSNQSPDAEGTSRKSTKDEDLVLLSRQRSNQSLDATERLRENSSKISHIFSILDNELSSTTFRNSDLETDVEKTHEEGFGSLSNEQVSTDCSNAFPTSSKILHSDLYNALNDDTKEEVVKDDDSDCKTDVEENIGKGQASVTKDEISADCGLVLTLSKTQSDLYNAFGDETHDEVVEEDDTDWETDVEETPYEIPHSLMKEQNSTNCCISSKTKSELYNALNDDTKEEIVEEDDRDREDDEEETIGKGHGSLRKEQVSDYCNVVSTSSNTQGDLYDAINDDTKEEVVQEDVEEIPGEKPRYVRKEQVRDDCSFVPTVFKTHSHLYISCNDIQKDVVQENDEMEEYIKDLKYIEAVECSDDDQTVYTKSDLPQDILQDATEKVDKNETKPSKDRTAKEDEEELWKVSSPVSETKDKSFFSRRSLEALSASTASFIQEEDDDEIGKPQDDGPAEVVNVIVTSPTEEEACSSPTTITTLDREPEFDTTMEEMMLYEMFGENYDELVEAMTREEKVELQAKLMAKIAAEDETELQQRLALIGGGRRSRSVSNSPLSLPASPGDISVCKLPTSSPGQRDDLESNISLESTPNLGLVVRETENRIPSNAITYLLPEVSTHQSKVSSSLQRRQIRGPFSPTSGRDLSSSSPKNSPQRTPFRVPSSPMSSRKTGSRIPKPVFLTPTTPTRSEFHTTPVSRPHTHRTPLHNLKMTSRLLPTESPVADYLRNNPAPPLVRNVVAKDTSRDLESTLVEVDTMRLPSHVPCCPLPANTYVKAGGRAEEVKIDNLAGPAFSYIPDAYGQIINSEAKVTKHVGRRRVEEEEYEIPGGVVDSFQSPASLEKSILETKIVRKFALPRN